MNMKYCKGIFTFVKQERYSGRQSGDAGVSAGTPEENLPDLRNR